MVMPIVRLRVNVTPSVADVLKSEAKEHKISITELVRLMIELWWLIWIERKKGNEIVVQVQRPWYRGGDYIAREIIVP